MTGFRTFAAPHLVAIALTLVVPAALAWWARRRGPSAARAISIGWAGVMAANEVLYWSVRWIELGPWGFLANHLPLNLCGAAVLLTIATLVSPRRWAYGILYFWGLVGAGNAVLTPGALAVDFPEYRFFQYFVAHSGIVGAVLFMTWGLGQRPGVRDLVRAFVALNGLALLAAAANLLLGANYLYLSAPPPGTVSPFFFAPWPWYLLLLEFLGAAMFLLVLAPFLGRRNRPSRASPG